MPIADTTQAAALTFDAAVSRALSRRLSDMPYPRTGVDSAAPAPQATDATAPAEASASTND